MKHVVQKKMLGKISILTILLVGLSSVVMLGQGVVHTPMYISTTVVKGPSIESDSPNDVKLSNRNTSEVGSITLVRTELDQILIDISDSIMLKDSEGNKIEMDINSQMEQFNPTSAEISLVGFLNEQLKGNMYKGKLKTTIEYL